MCNAIVYMPLNVVNRQKIVGCVSDLGQNSLTKPQ